VDGRVVVALLRVGNRGREESDEGRKYRVLGWAYVVTFAVIAFLHGKGYYLAPAYPMLFAAGGVVCESWARAAPRLRWLKPAFVLILSVPFLALLPIFAPVISVERYVAFQESDPLLTAGQRAQPRAVSFAAVLFR